MTGLFDFAMDTNPKVKFQQEFKDFLQKHNMHLRDDQHSDDVTWAIYALWQEIQELKQ